MHALEVLGPEGTDDSSRGRRSREGDDADLGVNHQRLADVGAARQDREHPLGESGLFEDPGQDHTTRDDGARVGLQDHRVTEREGGRDRTYREDQRKVKGCDDADDAGRDASREAQAGRFASQDIPRRVRREGRGLEALLGGNVDLQASFGPDAPGLAHDPVGELVGVVEEELTRPSKDGTSLVKGSRGPLTLIRRGNGGRLGDVRHAGATASSELFPGRRLHHRGVTATTGAPPIEGDVAPPRPFVEKGHMNPLVKTSLFTYHSFGSLRLRGR